MTERRLGALLKGIENIEIKGNVGVKLNGATLDSRMVRPGDLFVAIKGTNSDGHAFIQSALDRGAIAVICEKIPETIIGSATWIISGDVRKAAGEFAANFYDHPSDKMKLIGVTGTNGKTTVATLLYSLFKELGYKVGLISTIEIRIGEEILESKLTTPDVLSLNNTLNRMQLAGCQYVFMEVSSHAIVQKRIYGLLFKGGVFTNISHDHLDYHGTFKNYIQAKKEFFDLLPSDSFAMINADDRNGEIIIQNSVAKIYRYSLRTLADYKAKIVSEDSFGIYLDINGTRFMTRLIGKFNAYNLLGVYGVCDLLKVADQEDILLKMSGLKAAKGRLEIINDAPTIIIDYAHTPDALKQVLETLYKLKDRQKIITVIGCGGDRDKSKRPLMGKVACEGSDRVILTSDNPRSEDPQMIIDQMKKDIDKQNRRKILEIVNRKSAIAVAIQMAQRRDLVLVAGKGHEEYQIVKGEKIHLSDHQIVKEILSEDI